ncbi:MAG TPA: hypothetical protein VHZ51_01845 [Ktedonobacteraceae bacterium]|jgi:hypothetical protein|nr:hypothetical protein [Ktedonobacteraceae bacterium]
MKGTLRRSSTNAQHLRTTARFSSHVMEVYKVDSHISRRFPPIRLKNRRTFAPFTKKTTSILVGNPLEELAYQDTCCGSCQFNAGIYNVMPPQKRSFTEKVPRCSSGRASAHVGGQNPLTSDGIYQQ